MTTKYALLGATGATGSAILRHLIAHPPRDITLSLYVRSKAKLLKAFPDLETTAPYPIHIYEGSNTDVAVLRRCLEDVQVIFMCIATNVARKDDMLFISTATAVTDALKALQTEKRQAYRTPTILVLRATPLNPKFEQEFGGVGETVLWFALDYVYNKMIEANKHYEAEAEANPGLLEVIYVDPPAIHDEHGREATGYELLLEPKKDLSGVVSYTDLGIAFCEIAERKNEFEGQGVVVMGTGKINLTWSSNASQILLNARAKLLGW